MLTSNFKSIEECITSLLKQGYEEDFDENGPSGAWIKNDSYPDNEYQWAIAFIVYVKTNHYMLVYSDNLTMNY